MSWRRLLLFYCIHISASSSEAKQRGRNKYKKVIKFIENKPDGFEERYFVARDIDRNNNLQILSHDVVYLESHDDVRLLKEKKKNNKGDDRDKRTDDKKGDSGKKQGGKGNKKKDEPIEEASSRSPTTLPTAPIPASSNIKSPSLSSHITSSPTRSPSLPTLISTVEVSETQTAFVTGSPSKSNNNAIMSPSPPTNFPTLSISRTENVTNNESTSDSKSNPSILLQSKNLTIHPSFSPTQIIKVSQDPTSTPSLKISESPTSHISSNPSSHISSNPSSHISSNPSSVPSVLPSLEISQIPSSFPTLISTSESSEGPSSFPTQTSTNEPSEAPEIIPLRVIPLPVFAMFLSTESPISNVDILTNATSAHMSNFFLATIPEPFGFKTLSVKLSSREQLSRRLQDTSIFFFDGRSEFITEEIIHFDLVIETIKKAFSGTNMDSFEDDLRANGIDVLSSSVHLTSDDMNSDIDAMKVDEEDENNTATVAIGNSFARKNSIYVVWGLAATTMVTFFALLAAAIRKHKSNMSYSYEHFGGSSTMSSQDKMSASLTSQSNDSIPITNPKSTPTGKFIHIGQLHRLSNASSITDPMRFYATPKKVSFSEDEFDYPKKVSFNNEDFKKVTFSEDELDSPQKVPFSEDEFDYPKKVSFNKQEVDKAKRVKFSEDEFGSPQKVSFSEDENDSPIVFGNSKQRRKYEVNHKEKEGNEKHLYQDDSILFSYSSRSRPKSMDTWKNRIPPRRNDRAWYTNEELNFNETVSDHKGFDGTMYI